MRSCPRRRANRCSTWKLNSRQRIVQDRITNYFQKYLPASLEVTNEMVSATGVAPGTPKFQQRQGAR